MDKKYIEKEITIEAKYKLKGTLSVPHNSNDKVPAVLFIHGSGKVDRDENAKELSTNVFKYLSDELVSLGFAALRYDKRGCGESEGGYLETGFWDLVDDAESAVDFLKKQPEIDPNKIILIGHSEGCAVAPAVNDRVKAQGIVLIAGFIGGAFDSSQYQINGMLKEVSGMKGLKGKLLRLLIREEKIKKQNEKVFDKIMKSEEAVIRIQGKKINAKWMREHKTFNVNGYLEKIECPLLAIVGSKDVQVVPEHTKLMSDIVKCPFEYHIIDDMNHLLRNQPEAITMLGLKKIYKEAVKKPIEPKLIEILDKWIIQFIN